MPKRVQQPSHRILVVEDEQRVLDRIERQLTKAGYHIVTATNGVQALERVSSDSFDLILLDIVMPIKNGFEVLMELRTRQHPTPVIIASSLGHDDDKEYALELGAIEYFLKATHFPNIVSHIDRVLKGGRARVKN